MSQKKPWTKFHSIVIIIFSLAVICVWSIWGYFEWGDWEDISFLQFLQPIESIVSPRTQIIENSLPLNRISSWSVRGHISHIKVVDKNLVVFKSGLTFTVLDAVSGRYIFQGIAQSRSLDADQERVYVGFIDDVQSYNLRTAQPVWLYQQHPPNGHGSIYVFVEGDRLKVFSEDSSGYFIKRIYTLDIQTGKLLSEEENPGNIPPPNYNRLYRTTTNTNTEYTIDSDRRIVATDIQTGREIGYLEMSNPSEYDKIAASDEFLAVYNDNNRELIIFKQKK